MDFIENNYGIRLNDFVYIAHKGLFMKDFDRGIKMLDKYGPTVISIIRENIQDLDNYSNFENFIFNQLKEQKNN